MCISAYLALSKFQFNYKISLRFMHWNGLMDFSLFRSIPSPNITQTASYQWPSSPILPPISSRTPHLVPETQMPNSQQMAITNSAHNNSYNHHHHKSAGSWIESDEQANDDQFSSIMQERTSSSSGSFNKYTRQRERASRSLDKY